MLLTSAAPPDTSSAALIGAAIAGQPLNRFHIVALTFLRARQLQAGAKPRVEAGSHRPTRVALLEVLADTISWTIVDAPPPKVAIAVA